MDNGLILPPGELTLSNHSRFHVQRFGLNTGPTFILEAGLTMMSACWGWLAPELAKTGQVICYDRAGLGWSEERSGLRDAGQIAKELSDLLQKLDVQPPVVLVGHSMGALIHRALIRENPRIPSAVVWLDPSHPELPRRDRRMRSFFFFLELAHFLAARNLPSIGFRIIPQLESLPKADYNALRHFLRAPAHLKTTAREARASRISADQVGGTNLGSVPLLIVSAQQNALRNWSSYQRELAELSSRSRQITFSDVSHLSMLANEKHALRVAAETRRFLEEDRT